jgi:hypothetical protein
MHQRRAQRRLADATGRRGVFSERSGRFTVRASSPGFFGVRCGVQFDQGVGHTDDAGRAAELAAMGFAVEEAGGGDAGTGHGGPETTRRATIDGADESVGH